MAKSKMKDPNSLYFNLNKMKVERDLVNEFIPCSGEADLPAAEKFRKIQNQYYRYYNDGDSQGPERLVRKYFGNKAGYRHTALFDEQYEKVVELLLLKAYAELSLLKMTGVKGPKESVMVRYG